MLRMSKRVEEPETSSECERNYNLKVNRYINWSFG